VPVGGAQGGGGVIGAPGGAGGQHPKICGRTQIGT
jgi:hypothetical protein